MCGCWVGVLRLWWYATKCSSSTVWSFIALIYQGIALRTSYGGVFFNLNKRLQLLFLNINVKKKIEFVHHELKFLVVCLSPYVL